MKTTTIRGPLLAAALLILLSASAAAQTLPLRSVTLYVGGVGYFRREGVVEGTRDLEFSFKASEVNDLLKSLTLQDLDGGRIRGVTYGSQDPADKRLRSFAVNLSGNPGLPAILSQLRGERIKVALPDQVEGVLIGVEPSQDKDGVPSHQVNLLTSEGLRSFPLRELRHISFVDPRMDGEFRRALAVLAESRDMDKKTIRVGFEGSGPRRVTMGYLSEAPVWKTAYRLVLGEGKSHYLQGWAVVENASDEDWRDVNLSLVSGRPISFVMDLATPRYVTRPVVRPSVAAGPAPKTYDDTLRSSGAAAGAAKAAPAPAPAMAMRQAESMAAMDSAAYEEDSSYGEPESYGSGVSGYGVLESSGSFVRYRIAHPVSLPRRESAMFPLVDGAVTGSKVSVYDRTVDPKRPLLGVELVNGTPYSLLAGPLTVFDSGAYAGDALMDDLLPGADRLVTFAVDMETEVAPEEGSQAETITAMTISRGILTLNKSLRRESSYIVKNGAAAAKELVIVRPLDPSWKLLQPSAAPELTRDTQRFRLSVPAKATEVLRIAEERQLSQTLALLSLQDAQLVRYSSERTAGAAVKRAFAQITERRSAIQTVVAERQEAERRLTQFKNEQTRIRNNMSSISSSSELYKRYMALLSEQEDEIGRLLQRIDALYGREKELNEEMSKFILGLELK